MEKTITSKNFNYLLFALLIIAGIGVTALSFYDVKAGIIYSTLLLIGIASITLVNFFTRKDVDLEPINKFIKTPITTKLTLATFYYLLGSVIPFLISPIIKKVFNFSITTLSIPLSSVGNLSQSFNIASIEQSMSFKLFVNFFTAGVIETFLYSYVAIIVGIMLGIFIISLTKKSNDKKYKVLPIMTIALSFATILFVTSHQLNATYTLGAFIIAGLFLTLSNLSIYFYGIFLSFWVGWHGSNNIIYLIEQEGLLLVLKGFLSYFGIIYVTLYFLLVVYLINNWEQTKKDLA